MSLKIGYTFFYIRGLFQKQLEIYKTSTLNNTRRKIIIYNYVQRDNTERRRQERRPTFREIIYVRGFNNEFIHLTDIKGLPARHTRTHTQHTHTTHSCTCTLTGQTTQG